MQASDATAYIANIIRGPGYAPCKDEWGLQQQIRSRLESAGVSVQLEFRWSINRYDLVAVHEGYNIVLELKVGGEPTSVLRQLTRYATTDGTDGVILATTKHRHLSLRRSTLDGTPFEIAHVLCL